MLMATDDKRTAVAQILGFNKELAEKVRRSFDCYVKPRGEIRCINILVHDDEMDPLTALAFAKDMGWHPNPHKAADKLGLSDVSWTLVEAFDFRVPKGRDDRESQTLREVRTMVLEALAIRGER